MDFYIRIKYTVSYKNLSSILLLGTNTLEKKSLRTESSTFFHVTCRSTAFLWLFLISLIVFYITGSFQQFLDSTYSIILSISFFTSIIICIISFAGLVQAFIYLFLIQRKKYVAYIFLYLASIFTSGIIILLLQTFDFITSGIPE